MIDKFIKDFVKYIPSQLVLGLIGIIAIPIVTRLFSPSDYGNYVLVITTMSILTIIIGWLSMSVIRFYSIFELEGRLKVLSSLVVKWVVVSVAILVFIFLSIIFLTKAKLGAQLYHLMLIGVVVFVFSALFQVLSSFLRAKREVKFYSGFIIWKSISKLTFGILLVVAFGYGVEGLLWGEIFSIVIVLPLIWKYAIGKFPRRTSFSLDLTKEMAKYGFPLVMANLAAWILSLSDRYILEFFRSSQEVGVYSASYIISEKSILLVVSLFMIASNPISMKIWEREGKIKSKEFITKVTRYYLVVCLPLVVGMSVLSGSLIEFFTAPEYHQAFRIVPFVTLGIFFLGLQQRFQSGLLFYKRTKFIMIGIIISGLLNLCLNLLLVPKYGYMAAAITTVVSYVALLILMILFSRGFLVWEFPFKSLLRVTICSGIMGLVVYYLNGLIDTSFLFLIALVVLGMAIYALSICFIGEIKNEEKDFLIEKIRGLIKRNNGKA